MHDNRAVRVHLDPKSHVLWAFRAFSKARVRFVHRGPRPSRILAPCVHTLLCTSWMFRYSIVDVPVELFPKPPSVSGTWDDLRSHDVFQHFRVQANVAQSKRKGQRCEVVTVYGLCLVTRMCILRAVVAMGNDAPPYPKSVGAPIASHRVVGSPPSAAPMQVNPPSRLIKKNRSQSQR